MLVEELFLLKDILRKIWNERAESPYMAKTRELQETKTRGKQFVRKA